MKSLLSLCAVIAFSGVSLADCHGVSVSGHFGGHGYGHNVGVGLYGGVYAAPVVTVAAPVLQVSAPAYACPCEAPAADAGLGPVLLSRGAYGAYGGSVGSVFVNSGYGYNSFVARHGVRDVRVVEVVRDRNVRRVNANRNSGVVGIAKAAVNTVRNVLGAVIGR
jgi:hypothetical protein